MIKKLVPYLKGYGKYALICCLCMIGEAVLELTMPFLMSKIVDVGIPNQDLGYVLKIGGLMVLVAIISMACGAGGSRFSALAGMGFGSQLRKAVFDKVQTFSFSNIDKYSTASLVMRTTTDINSIQNTFIMMNKMLRKNRKVLEQMRDKKIILNKCVLDSNDVATFEYETKLKVFASVPPVDDRQSRIEPIIKFISKANL